VIAALLAGHTQEEAARAAGISLNTLNRWMGWPEFKQAYRQARQAVIEHAVARLSGLASAAVACLERNLACGVASSEIKAALGVLANLKALGAADIEERLDALEERLARPTAVVSARSPGNGSGT
jgi:hypothetical protein